MYVFDLDGTLTLVGDRARYLMQRRKDWDAYFAACKEDKPNWPIVELYNLLFSRSHTIVLTGRREDCREKTLEWFEDNNLCHPDALLMRPIRDHRHDVILKPKMLRKYIANRDEPTTVEAIFEDRNSMVAKWRELGYTCLQVAEGDF